MVTLMYFSVSVKVPVKNSPVFFAVEVAVMSLPGLHFSDTLFDCGVRWGQSLYTFGDLFQLFALQSQKLYYKPFL